MVSGRKALVKHGYFNVFENSELRDEIVALKNEPKSLTSDLDQA